MKTVLVVDDDESIRAFIRLALAKRNWVVLEAEDGLDGLARFMLHHPDVLLTDISMPKSDGLEMLTNLRQSGDLIGVHVVIMSGVLSFAKIKETKVEADALLSKPFTLPELYSAVGM